MSISKAINLTSKRSEQPAEIRKESLSPATNLPNVRPPNHDDITVRGYVNGTLRLLTSPLVSMPEVNTAVAKNTRSKKHERLVAGQHTSNSCKLPKQELIVALRDFKHFQMRKQQAKSNVAKLKSVQQTRQKRVKMWLAYNKKFKNTQQTNQDPNQNDNERIPHLN